MIRSSISALTSFSTGNSQDFPHTESTRLLIGVVSVRCKTHRLVLQM